MVIGTFAALPYIHLQLEARRRMYPDVPLLIHDDGSSQAGELNALAQRYGAEFVTFPPRKRHHLGDLNVYPAALRWCRERGFRYLLKISRRWLWQTDWRDDLRALFGATDAPTVSNYSASYGFGFRTECVAFDVKYWACQGFFDDVQDRIREERHVFVEHYIHRWAERLSGEGTQKWLKWQAEHPTASDRQGYAPWDLMGTCRLQTNPTRLWHDSNPMEDYVALSQRWSLPYSVADFFDPNAGEGIGEACIPGRA
jgi:hypothetical protein